MNSLKELRDLNRKVREVSHETASSDKKNFSSLKTQAIESAIRNKKKLEEDKAGKENKFQFFTYSVKAAFIFILISVICFQSYRIVFSEPPHPFNEGMVKIADYKKARKFMSSLLNTNNRRNMESYIKNGIQPEYKDEILETADELDSHAVIGEIMLREWRENDALFDVVCPVEKDAVIFSLTYDKKQFRIVKAEKYPGYAEKEMSDN